MIKFFFGFFGILTLVDASFLVVSIMTHHMSAVILWGLSAGLAAFMTGSILHEIRDRMNERNGL